MPDVEISIGRLNELDDPGCREFSVGDGDWPFRGFVVRQGDEVFAYQNVCVHAGHPLNWSPHRFLTKDGQAIICASHGATFDIRTGHCFAGPGSGKSLRRVRTEIRDGEIFLTAPDRHV